MGKELENQLRSNLQNYANQMTGKTSNSPESKAIMASLAKTIAAESKIDGKEAAALYANKPDLQSKYSQHLQDQAFKRHNKIESQQNKNNELSQNKFSSLSNFGKYIGNVPNRLQSLASRGVDGLDRVRGLNPEQRNPDTAHQTFLRNLKNNERLDGINWGHILNPLNRSNTLDRYLAPSGSSLDKRTDKSQEDVLRKNLAQDQKSRELPKLRDGATEKEKQSHEAARKKMDEIADKKREFFQDRLRNLATKDLAKEVSNINKLEKKGKTAEADKAKKELLSKTLNELKLNPNNKKSFQDDGRTLFEKAARLSYLHKQFGIAGEDPSLAISKALNKAVKDSSSDLAAKMAAGERSSKLAGAVEELGTLRSGIFNTASGDKEFNKLAATLGSTLDEIARRESEASLKSVGILSEDKKAKIEEDAQINRDKKEIQEQLNNLNKEFSKFREQEAERDAKEQEEKYQKERQDNMSQIFTLIEEIARLKTSSGDESEIKKLEENLRDKFTTESETRAKHQIDKIEKQVDAAIADKSLESVKKLSEEISTLLETPVNKASSESIIKGLESSNIGLTGSAEDLGLKGNILNSLMQGSAANALLGAGSTPETGTLTDAQKKDLSMHKNQLNGQLKLNKMNLKLKEFELNELKKNKGAAGLIAKIESEISDLEGKVDTLEREEKKLEPLTA